MNLKNYTSTVDASKSMAKIEEMLVEIGASDINKKYENKICTGITFLLFDLNIGKSIAFKLTADVDSVFRVLYEKIKRPTASNKQSTMQQANKTAWKLLSDLVEIQCSTILMGQAKPLQIFLPYVYDIENNQTLYEKVIAGKVKLLN